MNDASNSQPIETGKEMAALVAAYRQSGQSLKAFAQGQGIRPTRLHYWVYQKNQKPKARSLIKPSRVRPTDAFQEVKFEAGSALLQSWGAEVSVARGLNVRFSSTASPDWIGAVVQALQRPC